MKKLTAIMAAAMLVFAFSACNKKNNDPNDPNNGGNDKPTELTVAQMPDFVMQTSQLGYQGIKDALAKMNYIVVMDTTMAENGAFAIAFAPNAEEVAAYKECMQYRGEDMEAYKKAVAKLSVVYAFQGSETLSQGTVALFAENATVDNFMKMENGYTIPWATFDWNGQILDSDYQSQYSAVKEGATSLDFAEHTEFLRAMNINSTNNEFMKSEKEEAIFQLNPGTYALTFVFSKR